MYKILINIITKNKDKWIFYQEDGADYVASSLDDIKDKALELLDEYGEDNVKIVDQKSGDDGKKDIATYLFGNGMGGTSDYNELENKPKINGVELINNKSLKDLGIIIPSNEDFTLEGLGEKSYNSLDDKPKIPKKVSELENDSEYETVENTDAKVAGAKTYADEAIAHLVGSAPETLDTLEEVAKAIQDNETVVDALNAAIGSKADKTELGMKQDTLTAGNNITIEDNVISASGGNIPTYVYLGYTVPTGIISDKKFLSEISQSITNCLTSGASAKARIDLQSGTLSTGDTISVTYTCSRTIATTRTSFTYYSDNQWIQNYVDTDNLHHYIMRILTVSGTWSNNVFNATRIVSDFYKSNEILSMVSSSYIKANLLTKTNTTAYTPTSNYHPATKKYVDDKSSTKIGNEQFVFAKTFNGKDNENYAKLFYQSGCTDSEVCSYFSDILTKMYTNPQATYYNQTSGILLLTLPNINNGFCGVFEYYAPTRKFYSVNTEYNRSVVYEIEWSGEIDDEKKKITVSNVKINADLIKTDIPTDNQHVANKKYVDDTISAKGGDKLHDYNIYTITLDDYNLKGTFPTITDTTTLTKFDEILTDIYKKRIAANATYDNAFLIVYSQADTFIFRTSTIGSSYCNLYGTYIEQPIDHNGYTCSYQFNITGTLDTTAQTFKTTKVKFDSNSRRLLLTNNTLSYTPTDSYHPATKKYVDDNKYTLPIASADTLGGIKLGKGLSADENGVVSASGCDIPVYNFKMTSEYHKVTSTVTYVYMSSDDKIALQNIIQNAYDKGLETFALFVNQRVGTYTGTNEMHQDYLLTIVNGNLIKNKPSSLLLAGYSQGNSTFTDVYLSKLNILLQLSWNGDSCTVGFARYINVELRPLSSDNTVVYVPTSDYNPATKKYVDDQVGNINTVLATLTTVSGVTK